MLSKTQDYFKQHFLTSRLGFYFLLLVVFACNLSSHTFAFWPGDNWWLRSVYWLVYLTLDAGFIFCLYLLLKHLALIKSSALTFITAILLAWLPFSLTMASIDVATGRGTSRYIEELHNTGFLTAFFSQFVLQTAIKHISFGILLFVLHFYTRSSAGTATSHNDQYQTEIASKHSNYSPNSTQNKPIDLSNISFMTKLPADIYATPMLLQAQEHYIHVTTQNGSTLVLYKFGQALNELPPSLGLQTHRSFWVAYDNIQGWSKCASGIKLILHYGISQNNASDKTITAPVSRRFEQLIRDSFTEI